MRGESDHYIVITIPSNSSASQSRAGHPQAAVKAKKAEESFRWTSGVISVEFDGYAHCKFQIEGKGRAIQRGLNFLHETLDNRLPVCEEIDRRKPLISPVDPNQSLIGKVVGAANLGNGRGRNRVFTNRQQVAAEIINRRDSRTVGAAQEETPAEMASRAGMKLNSPSLHLVEDQVFKVDTNDATLCAGQ